MAKPTTLPTWAIGASASKTAPNAQQQDVGYLPKDFPTSAEFNFLFNLYYDWFNYIDTELSIADGENTTQIASVSKTFVYITLSNYDALLTPTLNDTIDRKASDLKEEITIETDNKLTTLENDINTTISNLVISSPGSITGFEYKISNGNFISLNVGVATLHLDSAVVWEIDPTKLFLLRTSTSSNQLFINATYTNWEYSGSGGIMAPTATAFAVGVKSFFFIIVSGTNSPFLLADTLSSGANAVARYRAIFSIALSTNVFIRRLGGTIVFSSGGQNKAINTWNRGNRFFMSMQSTTDYRTKVIVDTLGLFGGATSSFDVGDSPIIVNLDPETLAPSINGASYHCVVRANGAVGSQQDIEIRSDTIRELFGFTSTDTYILNSNLVANAIGFNVELYDPEIVLENASSSSHGATDVINYLDVTCIGWTDHREEQSIG